MELHPQPFKDLFSILLISFNSFTLESSVYQYMNSSLLFFLKPPSSNHAGNKTQALTHAAHLPAMSQDSDFQSICLLSLLMWEIICRALCVPRAHYPTELDPLTLASKYFQIFLILYIFGHGFPV